MKLDSDVCLLFIRVTVPIGYFTVNDKRMLDNTKLPLDEINRMSNTVKNDIDGIVKSVLEEETMVSNIEESVCARLYCISFDHSFYG